MGKEAVKIYPSFIAAGFVYNLVDSVDVLFRHARDFLKAYQPETLQLSSPLQGESAQVITSPNLTQAFYGKLNLALAYDYRDAFQKTYSPEYCDKVLYYFDKAVKEQNTEAMYQLTVFLFELAQQREKELGQCKKKMLKYSPELDLWLGERFWYLQQLRQNASGELKERVDFYYESVKSSCDVNTSQRQQPTTAGVIFPKKAFAPVYSTVLAAPAASIRDHQAVESTDALYNYKTVEWLEHKVPVADRQQRRYFGKDLLRYRNLAVMLEVWSAELWRVLVGESQPRNRIERDAQGNYLALSEIIAARKGRPHLCDYEPGLRHAGRVMFGKALLDDNDAHSLNLLVTIVGRESVVVGIDAEKSCWPMAAFFDGSENYPKETTVIARENSLPVRYEKGRFIQHQEQCDPFDRTDYLSETNDSMGQWTRDGYEDFPMPDSRRLIRRTMFSDQSNQKEIRNALAFYNDPVFKAEQHFTQAKSSCLRAFLLPRAVLDTVCEGEEQFKHHIIFDLERQRIRQRELLKASSVFHIFLATHKEQLGFAILFEIKKFGDANKYLANTNHYDEQTLLVSVVQEYTALLGTMFIEVSDSLRDALMNYQVYLRSNKLDELTRGVECLENRVLPFYRTTGMALEEQLCRDHIEKMRARIIQLQIKKNQEHPYYKRAQTVSVGLVAQKARISTVLSSICFEECKVKQDALGEMLDVVSQPGAIDWFYYPELLAQQEHYLKYLTAAADLAQIYQFYRNDIDDRQDADKALLLGMVLPFIRRQINTLANQPSSEELSYAKNLVKFCVFVLSLRRHDILDGIRIALKRAFGSVQQQGIAQGTAGFRGWLSANLDIQSEEIQQTVGETRQYNSETQITLANAIHTNTNWASFYQACRPLVESPDNDHVIRQANVVRCAA